MGSEKAAYYFLKSEYLRNSESWVSAKDVSSAIDLSIDRTRRVLTGLVLGGLVVTKIDGWRNYYKYKR